MDNGQLIEDPEVAEEYCSANPNRRQFQDGQPPSQLEFMEILMQGFQPTDQRVIRLSEHIDENSCVSFRFKKLILYTLNDLDIPASNITLASRGQLFELTRL